MTRRRDSSADSAHRFQWLCAQRGDPPLSPGPPPIKLARPPRLPKHERMSITREQIEQLLTEARRTGDRIFAGGCQRALQWDPDAMNACKAAIWGLE